jgi:nucleotide-binding universal stress UspA family protein
VSLVRAVHLGCPRKERQAEEVAVVVGVDGSEPSLRALQWAARQAAYMDAPLDVVTAWTFPEHPAPLGIVADVPWQDELVAEARTRLDALVSEQLTAEQRARAETKVIRGNAADVLLSATSPDDLLVVGTTGRGDFAELLLGSVGERCVRHARCPVVVVP